MAGEGKHVVTSFLEHEGRILLVRRSGRVGTYQGRWAGISGYLEPENSPLAQALIEIREETGLTAGEVELRSAAEPRPVCDAAQGRRWVVHPFLFHLRRPEGIRLNWENEEMRWVEPGEAAGLETVPSLAEILAACLKNAASGK